MLERQFVAVAQIETDERVSKCCRNRLNDGTKQGGQIDLTCHGFAHLPDQVQLLRLPSRDGIEIAHSLLIRTHFVLDTPAFSQFLLRDCIETRVIDGNCCKFGEAHQQCHDRLEPFQALGVS
jgi:hypothetical protein